MRAHAQPAAANATPARSTPMSAGRSANRQRQQVRDILTQPSSDELSDEEREQLRQRLLAVLDLGGAAAEEDLALNAISKLMAQPATRSNAVRRVELLTIAFRLLEPGEAERVHQALTRPQTSAAKTFAARFGRLSRHSRRRLENILARRRQASPRRASKESTAPRVARRRRRTGVPQRVANQKLRDFIRVRNTRHPLGPGVFGPAPLTGEVVGKPLAAAYKPIRKAFRLLPKAIKRLVMAAVYLGRSVLGFFDGLTTGLTSKLSSKDLDRVLDKRPAIWELPVFFPAFSVGISVGIVRDVAKTLKELFTTNPLTLLEEMVGFVLKLFTAEGEKTARLMGEATGSEFSKKISALTRKDFVGFAYGIGELIGPIVLAVLLAVIPGGALGLAGRLAARVARMAKLAKRLETSTKLRKMAERLGNFGRRRKSGDGESGDGDFSITGKRKKKGKRKGKGKGRRGSSGSGGGAQTSGRSSDGGSADVETKPAKKGWRGKPRIEDGDSKKGWIHIDERHVSGTKSHGVADLFPAGTTREQLQKLADDIVDNGERISEVGKTIQNFEKRVTINGQSDTVRVVVDTSDGSVITMFPVRGVMLDTLGSAKGWDLVFKKYLKGDDNQGFNLFPEDTTRAELQTAARKIVRTSAKLKQDKAVWPADPSKKVDVYEKGIRIQGQHDTVRIIVDPKKSAILEMFPVRRIKMPNGDMKSGWAHIEAKHIKGQHPDGAGDLFPGGTTRSQLQDAAEDIVGNGKQLTGTKWYDDESKLVRKYEKEVELGDGATKKTTKVQVVIDARSGKILTMFPLPGAD
ncbi:MAG: hypothetical protein AAF560_12850 [Acidobacteriota bacterium]